MCEPSLGALIYPILITQINKWWVVAFGVVNLVKQLQKGQKGNVLKYSIIKMKNKMFIKLLFIIFVSFMNK